MNRPKMAQDALEQVPGHLRSRVEETSPGRAQDEPGNPVDKEDVLGVSNGDEDAREWPKKLRGTLECVSKRSELKENEDSPGRPGDEPDKLGGDMAAPGDFQTSQRCPRNVSNERVDQTDAPGRDRSPGGHRGEQEESEVIEGVRDHETVANHAGYNRKHPRSDGSTRVVETNAQRRENRPRGHLGERDWSHENDGDGAVLYEGDGCRTDGVTSGARTRNDSTQSR